MIIHLISLSLSSHKSNKANNDCLQSTQQPAVTVYSVFSLPSGGDNSITTPTSSFNNQTVSYFSIQQLIKNECIDVKTNSSADTYKSAASVI